MIYKLYTGGHPIRALIELIINLVVVTAVFSGVIELFDLDNTYVGKDPVLSVVFGFMGFIVCIYLYGYIVYEWLPKVIERMKNKREKK